jgi:hypothetical protein
VDVIQPIHLADALPSDTQEIANDVIGLFNKLKRK